jgi:hypothetical protein
MAGGRRGQTADVGEEAYALCDGDERGDEGPGVKEPALVRMVLYPDEVQSRPVRRYRDPLREVRRVGQRRDARPELQIPAVIGHSHPSVLAARRSAASFARS